ncbi:aryl-sulphate sulphohydrolase [Lentisphaera araneosa HTCC2155]|uniref:Aryl-sulphate sulphohydrolase n=1 Tax=Lentisphaera araneosa HTCC2155 TaxID=313628 RepID=A6DU79_9BACT|nr:sulfatase [Lentisphaera araneosa]EDM24809.1 aryl-sulphate sulphohydrolase [Lentisphaera araneosa HTCC2155]
MKYILKLLLSLPALLCADQKPNIILINVDDMGWTDIGSLGSEYYQTPNLDRLIANGIKFSNAYAGAANCAPSRACLISGQSSPRHGVYTVGSSERGKPEQRKLIPTPNQIFLPPNTRTIGHAMSDAGYETITLGKWHVGEDPLLQGFKYNVGGCHLGGPYNGGYHSPFKFPNCEAKEEGTYLTDYITGRAIDFIKDNAQKPFFMYFPFYAMHSPLQAKKDKVAKFKNIKTSKAHNNAIYAAMLESLDENIGRLVKVLEEFKLDKNTLIIFTTDNGGVWKFSKNWPLRAGKGSYFEGGIRVPTFAYWPGKIKAGSSSDIPITALDMYPTLLDIAESAKKEKKILDGASFKELLFGQAPKFDPQRPLVWHFPIYLQAGYNECHDMAFRTRPGSIIRIGDWKLHQYFEDGRFELYNLKDDLSEQNNLAAKHPEKVEKLLAQLNKWRQDMKAPIPRELNPQYKGQ